MLSGSFSIICSRPLRSCPIITAGRSLPATSVQLTRAQNASEKQGEAAQNNPPSPPFASPTPSDAQVRHCLLHHITHSGSAHLMPHQAPSLPPNDASPNVLPAIRQRWSPYRFLPQIVEQEKLSRCLEAARWAASSYNDQPWSFLLAKRENHDAFQQALACLLDA